MDGEPPAIVAPASPTHGQAATELYGRSPREVELCARAASPAYGYALGWLALTGLSFAIGSASKYGDNAGTRMLGPAFLGLSWGGLVGSTYAIMPKCHPYFAGGAPPEGAVTTSVPLVTALVMLAGVSAPIMVGINTGFIPTQWTNEERVMRLVVASGAGLVGALLPYVPFLSPRTLSAARELQRLRVEPVQSGLILGYGARF